MPQRRIFWTDVEREAVIDKLTEIRLQMNGHTWLHDLIQAQTQVLPPDRQRAIRSSSTRDFRPTVTERIEELKRAGNGFSALSTPIASGASLLPPTATLADMSTSALIEALLTRIVSPLERLDRILTMVETKLIPVFHALGQGPLPRPLLPADLPPTRDLMKPKALRIGVTGLTTQQFMHLRGRLPNWPDKVSLEYLNVKHDGIPKNLDKAIALIHTPHKYIERLRNELGRDRVLMVPGEVSLGEKKIRELIGA